MDNSVWFLGMTSQRTTVPFPKSKYTVGKSSATTLLNQQHVKISPPIIILHAQDGKGRGVRTQHRAASLSSGFCNLHLIKLSTRKTLTSLFSESAPVSRIIVTRWTHQATATGPSPSRVLRTGWGCTERRRQGGHLWKSPLLFLIVNSLQEKTGPYFWIPNHAAALGDDTLHSLLRLRGEPGQNQRSALYVAPYRHLRLEGNYNTFPLVFLFQLFVSSGLSLHWL